MACAYLRGLRCFAWSRETRPKPVKRPERALPGGSARWPDERGLQPPGGVQMVTGPDHPHGGSTGSPVLTAQIVAHRVDKAAVGKLVVPKRLAYLVVAGEAGREIAIPASDELAGVQ